MNLTAIRRAIGNILDDLDGCRVYPSIPDGLAASSVTSLVLAPGEPYVTYAEGAGLTNQNDVRLRVVVIPPQQAGAVRIMEEIDALLSCGPDQPRSIRTLLGDHISADGTACAVSTLDATIRTLDVNDLTCVVGEIEIKIMARC